MRRMFFAAAELDAIFIRPSFMGFIDNMILEGEISFWSEMMCR
jgi:hypothetical protein